METQSSLSSHKLVKKQMTCRLTIYENKSKKSLLVDPSIFLTTFLLVGTSSPRSLESHPMRNHCLFLTTI